MHIFECGEVGEQFAVAGEFDEDGELCVTTNDGVGGHKLYLEHEQVTSLIKVLADALASFYSEERT